MPGSTTISALTSADPSSNSLLVGVVNSTTVKTNVEEAVGYWSTAAGDMVYADGARSLARLAAPTSGAVMTYSSGTNAPSWSVPTSGAVLIASSLGVPTWLPLGTSGQVLQSTGGAPAWTPAGAGGTTAAWDLARATTIAITTAAYIAVAWDVEILDTDGAHSTVTASSAVTIPTSGVYVMGVSWLAAGISNAILCRLMEGTTILFEHNAGPAGLAAAGAAASILRHFASSGASIVPLFIARQAAEVLTTNTMHFWGHRLS